MILPPVNNLLPEIPLQQPRKGLAVTGFITGHFMYCIMDGIEVQSLGTLCQISLASSSAILGFHTHTKEVLGILRK